MPVEPAGDTNATGADAAGDDEKVLEEAMGAIMESIIMDQVKEMMSDMGLMDVG